MLLIFRVIWEARNIKSIFDLFFSFGHLKRNNERNFNQVYLTKVPFDYNNFPSELLIFSKEFS
jgi:hypothetical protein